MMEIIGFGLLILAIIWAIRMENGMNKLNETASRIEAHLANKKEKK